MKNPFVLIGSFAWFLVASPAYAELVELENLNWQEVPGSYITAYNEYAFVNVNFVRTEETIIYDFIGPDLNYARRETNCRTRRSRNLKFGTFKSRTQVELFRNQPDPWVQDSSPVLEFVCNL